MLYYIIRMVNGILRYFMSIKVNQALNLLRYPTPENLIFHNYNNIDA